MKIDKNWPIRSGIERTVALAGFPAGFFEEKVNEITAVFPEKATGISVSEKMATSTSKTSSSFK